MQFEISILDTGDAVTKIHPKRSFEIPILETGDAHLYAPEKKHFFLILSCKFYPGILLEKDKIIAFWTNIWSTETYVLEHGTNDKTYRTNHLKPPFLLFL